MLFDRLFLLSLCLSLIKGFDIGDGVGGSGVLPSVLLESWKIEHPTKFHSTSHLISQPSPLEHGFSSNLDLYFSTRTASLRGTSSFPTPFRQHPQISRRQHSCSFQKQEG